MFDDVTLQPAVVGGFRPRVHVSYADGHPTGGYHLPSWDSLACGKLSWNTEVREFTADDAAKLLVWCKFGWGW